MSRPHPAALFGIFVALIVAMCGAALLKGGLYLAKHEGDTFHLLQIVFRMADGQWPHLDFMSPIGAMASWPIAAFVGGGFGIGTAFILAQASVSIALLPAVLWVGISRLNMATAVLFGSIIFVLVNALVHGEAERSVSLSMHYNRWAWAIAFVAGGLAFFAPVHRQNGYLDGFFIGVALFLLLMIKVTYFAAFGIPIFVALVMRRAFDTLFVAALVGLIAAGAVTLMAGFGYWGAYLGDLLEVSRSAVRPFPSEPLGAVMAAPAFLTGSITLLAGIIFLRQSGQGAEGLWLLLLVPGFFYVTYQNWANDPQWLLFLTVFLLATAPKDNAANGFGWPLRSATMVTALVAFALISSSFFNMAYSPFRHLKVDADRYVQFLPRATVHGDLFATRLRAYRADQRGPLDVTGTGLAAYQDIPEAIEVANFRGEDLPVCAVELGMIAWFETIVTDLEAAGHAGKKIFAADLFSSHWLFGEFAPIPQGAPWYYGGLPGFENADLLIVPLCPIIHEVRSAVLKDIEESGAELAEIQRTKLYILYKITDVPAPSQDGQDGQDG